MLQLQNLKHVSVLQGSYTNGATATGTVDTLGFDSVLVSVTVATSDSTSNNPSVFVVGEGDTSTAFTNITAAVGDTAWTIPNADTANPQVFAFHVKTGGARKRYLKLSISPTTTQIISATALLSRADELPNSTTEQGVVAAVNV